MSQTRANPDIDGLWDYSDPGASEQRFREALAGVTTDPNLRLELLTQIARTHSLRRQFEDAHGILDGVERELGGSAARPRIRYLLERGRTFNSAGDPAAARPLFAEAQAAAEASGEDYLAVDAAHMLAIVAPPEQALDLNLRALALAEASADPGTHGWRCALYNNIGWSYHERGDYEQAFDYLQKAVPCREAQGKAKEARIARWCVARVRRDLGQTTAALAEQQRLMAEYEALGEPSGYVFEEIGELLLLAGREDEARPYFRQACDILSQDGWLVASEAGRLERLRALGEA